MHPAPSGWGYPDPVPSCPYTLLCCAAGKRVLLPSNSAFLKGWTETAVVIAPGKVQQMVVLRNCYRCLCSERVLQRETVFMKTVSNAKGEIIFWVLLNFSAKLLIHLC